MGVRRNRFFVHAIAVCIGLFGTVASAQDNSGKPIRLVVGFAVGGALDVTARIVGAKLAETLGQPVIVENRTGASSNLAAEHVAKSAPDGLTLYMGSYVNALSLSLFKKLNYDPVKDLTPIARTVTTYAILLTHPGVQARNVQELVALAKSRPGKLTYSSSGIGSASHLAGELLAARAGLSLVHVPYKGSPPQLADMLAGHIDFTFVVLSQGLPYLTSDKARALAVTSLERSPFAPALPTVAESGFPGYEQTQWYALFGPAGMPEAMVTRLNREVLRVLQMPDVVKQLQAQGLEPAPSSPAELAALMKADIELYAKIVRDAGIKPE
jgi:tripartite-type tricarboxylate transporter receptor subunit TctC